MIFLEDELACVDVFERKRLVYRCFTHGVSRDAVDWRALMQNAFWAVHGVLAAVLLNRGRQNRDHPDCKLSIARNEIGIWFPPGWLQENKMVEGDLCLEKSFLGAAGFKLSYQ